MAILGFLNPLLFFTGEAWISLSFLLLFKLSILYLSDVIHGEQIPLEADRHSEVYAGLYYTIMLFQSLQQM